MQNNIPMQYIICNVKWSTKSIIIIDDQLGKEIKLKSYKLNETKRIIHFQKGIIITKKIEHPSIETQLQSSYK